MKNIPPIIYLQIGDDCITDDFSVLFGDDITWCQDKINDNDIKYIRAPKSSKVANDSTSDNTGSPKLSGAVCRWCYGHKDMCAKCVFGSEFSPAAQHRAGA